MDNRAISRDINILRKIGIEALSEKLGPVGMAEFMRQFDSGHGDYTKERHEWLDKISLDEICGQIETGRK